MTEPSETRAIVYEIYALAREFSSSSVSLYEITRIELLYYFTLLVNPHLTWIAVDYVLRGNRAHDYLICHPARLVK